jgi:hypothetical protein
MVLYARFTGARLKLTAAKLETVWVERKYSDITWHYAKPKKVEKGAKVEIAHGGLCRNIPRLFLQGGRAGLGRPLGTGAQHRGR